MEVTMLPKKITYFLFFVLLTVTVLIGVRVDKYNRKNFKKIISFDSLIVDYFKKERLVEYLKKYTVFDKSGNEIKFSRIGKANDGGYVTPELAVKKTQALLGYGIGGDASFEEHFASKYNIPSFGFDCGTDYKSSNKNFTFFKQCIASDKFLSNIQNSSKNITTFGQQLKTLQLTNKKVFIKNGYRRG